MSTENAGSQNKELNDSPARYTKYTQFSIVAITDGKTRILLRLNFTKNLNDYYPRTPNNLVLTVPDLIKNAALFLKMEMELVVRSFCACIVTIVNRPMMVIKVFFIIFLSFKIDENKLLPFSI